MYIYDSQPVRVRTRALVARVPSTVRSTRTHPPLGVRLCFHVLESAGDVIVVVLGTNLVYVTISVRIVDGTPALRRSDGLSQCTFR